MFQSRGYIDFINHCGAYKGLNTSLKINKDIRLSVTRFLAGDPFRSLPSIRLTYDGIPTRLGDLVPLIRNYHNSNGNIRFILTLLSCTRRIRASVSPNISSITDGLSVDKLPN